jgi:hypothetical protein
MYSRNAQNDRALAVQPSKLTHVAAGTVTLHDLMGPAAPPMTIDAMVKDIDGMLDSLKRRRRDTAK